MIEYIFGGWNILMVDHGPMIVFIINWVVYQESSMVMDREGNRGCLSLETLHRF